MGRFSRSKFVNLAGLGNVDYFVIVLKCRLLMIPPGFDTVQIGPSRRRLVQVILFPVARVLNYVEPFLGAVDPAVAVG